MDNVESEINKTNMQTATILHMNHEENAESERRDQRHTASQQDIKSIKIQMDKLTYTIGELRDAIRGNDLGNPGMLPRVEKMEQEVHDLKVLFDDMALSIKKNQMYLLLAVGAISAVAGMILNKLIDYFSKK